MDWLISSDRLYFRKITEGDFDCIRTILQDIEIMYAWEHAFTDLEVREWMAKNMERYNNEGFSYFVMGSKQTNEFVGVMGPLVEDLDGVKEIGIAYILDKRYWGHGYAVEGAKACVDYAFHHLKARKVIAEIRPNNVPSRRVAEKLGMYIEGEYIKHYNHKDMLHLIYSVTR